MRRSPRSMEGGKDGDGHMAKHNALTGELLLIQQIKRDSKLRRGSFDERGVTLGIGDDCAILRPPAGHDVLVTTDFTLEGRHFRRDWHGLESAGHRCLARGLSDLAAMGARPLAAFLSLALPVGTRDREVALFFKGLRSLGDRFAVPLAGGDTAQAPAGAILADIILLGTAPRGTALRRDGARQGDLLYVTGSLGGAAAELSEMQTAGTNRKPNRRRDRRHDPGGVATNPQRFPEPRLKVGEALRRRRLATAAIDVSDGLSTDLRHLCEASGVGAEVDLESLPLHPLTLRSGPAEAVKLALHGGEDYELLFVVRPQTRLPRQIAGVPLTRIGRFVRATGRTPQVIQVASDGVRTPLAAGGWEHFRTHG